MCWWSYFTFGKRSERKIRSKGVLQATGWYTRCKKWNCAKRALHVSRCFITCSTYSTCARRKVFRLSHDKSWNEANCDKSLLASAHRRKRDVVIRFLQALRELKLRFELLEILLLEFQVTEKLEITGVLNFWWIYNVRKTACNILIFQDPVPIHYKEFRRCRSQTRKSLQVTRLTFWVDPAHFV